MPEPRWLYGTLPGLSSCGWRWLCCGLLLAVALALTAVPAGATHLGGCPHDGDATQDGQRTPADALLAFRHFLGLAAPPLSGCQQDHANVLNPQTSAITPADALCIFQQFLRLPSCLDALSGIPVRLEAQQGSGAQVSVTGSQHLVARVTDALGNAVAGVPVMFVIVQEPAPRQAEAIPASVAPPMAMTSATGEAVTTLTIGTTAGAITVEARAASLPPAVFTVTGRADRNSARLLEIGGNNQRGQQNQVLDSPFVVEVEDQFGNPLVGESVTFARLLGDGVFVDATGMPLRTRRRPAGGRPPAIAAQTTPSEVQITVTTDSNGVATARYRPGREPLQVVAAQAEAAPNTVVFRITLGPLAGNGIAPVNLAVGGGRGYTANSGTNNVSVFDATRPSSDVLATVDLRLVQTAFGAGAILGVAVNVPLNRLYVYGLIRDAEGESVVLLVVDTTTNTLVEPHDLDSDTRPGLTLVTLVDALALESLLGLQFGNLVTVDTGRRRVYAVLPGVAEVVEMNGSTVPVSIENGTLVAIEDSGTTLNIVGRVPVGQVATGVAVNTMTNRIYVTNRGFEDDPANDTLTVINGETLMASGTLTVGRSPLGVQVDETHNVIYVSNLFGAVGVDSSGAVSVIDGATHTVVQTIPTSGTTDLAVLVGEETESLPAGTDRLYVNDGSVIDVNTTTLSVVQRDFAGLQGKLGLNDSRTLLFGASRFDDAVAVFDVATHTVVETIRTGVEVGGLGLDAQTGTAYVSDFGGDRLFVIAPSGAFASVLLHAGDFTAPGQVEVDPEHGRIYIISPNVGVVLVLALDTRERVAALDLATLGIPTALGLDARRHLLYLPTNAGQLLVVDGARLSGTTRVDDALVAQVPIATPATSTFPGSVAVDTTERNLVYVTRCTIVMSNCDVETSHNIVVLRGPALNPDRSLRTPPAVLAEIPNVGVQFVERGQRQLALDTERQVLYVAGHSSALTVLDALRIVDAQGQIVPEPAMAVLGLLPVPVQQDPGVSPIELAFNATDGLLYVLGSSLVPFRQGFVSVINSGLVLDAQRGLRREPHPMVPDALLALSATIPVGIEPQFVAVDAARNRVVVSNRSPGAVTVLRGLSVTPAP